MDIREAIVSGLVVVVGVVLAHGFEVRRGRVRDMRRDALELSHLLTRVSGGYLDVQANTREGSDWWEIRQETFRVLARLRVALRTIRPLRGGRKARAAVDRITATMGAADMRLLSENRQIPKFALVEFTASDLERALWPRSSYSVMARWEYIRAAWEKDYPSWIPDDAGPPPQRLGDRVWAAADRMRRWWPKRRG